jgi:hypothetical protein
MGDRNREADTEQHREAGLIKAKLSDVAIIRILPDLSKVQARCMEK